MGITREDVFDACKHLAAKQVMPSIRTVRKELGDTGSENTILKHLNHWRERLLEIAGMAELDTNVRLVNELVLDTEEDGVSFSSLQTELKQSQAHNESLSNELIRIERLYLNLQNDIQTLQIEHQDLVKDYEASIKERNHLQVILDEIKGERAQAIQKIIDDKNQKIERLQQELAEVNKEMVDRIEAMGGRYDEALIQEKVKNINVVAKVESLEKELKKTKEALKREETKNQPLRDTLKRQEAFIQEVVTFEQLQAYEQKRIQAIMTPKTDE